MSWLGTLWSFPPDGFSGKFIAKTRHSTVYVLGNNCERNWSGCDSLLSVVKARKQPVAALLRHMPCLVTLFAWPKNSR